MTTSHGSLPAAQSRCGWCGALIDWERQGERHYDGVCIGNKPGHTDAVLNRYHSATKKEREADRA